MKTIKLKFLFVSVLLCSIGLSSCDIQDYDIQIPERVFGRLDILQKNLTSEAKDGSNLSFNYQVTDAKEQIKFETKIADDRFRSVLSYNNEEAGWIEASVFDIDLQEVINKKNMNIIVEKHAKTLKKKFDVKTISRIADILEGLPEMLYNELGQKEYANESTLSIFYHLATFNTARRSYEKRWSGDCQCEINSNYLNGRSPFFCVEDVMVSDDWVYDFIKEKSAIKKSEGYQFNPETLLKYLSNESGQLVSASKLNKLLREEFDYFWRKLNVKERQQINSKNNTLLMIQMITTRSETDDSAYDPLCWLMGVSSGSDCGCCGNYSGPCWWCALDCLAHDKLCVDCLEGSWLSWACLSGCKPGC